MSDDVVIRRVTASDLASIVALLADDEIGAGRESSDDLMPYQRVFEVIDADKHELLVVAERNGEVIGTLQLSLLPGLSRRGAFRAQIEGVRVASNERGNALGIHLIKWAIGQARSRLHRNARRIQADALTADMSAMPDDATIPQPVTEDLADGRCLPTDRDAVPSDSPDLRQLQRRPTKLVSSPGRLLSHPQAFARAAPRAPAGRIPVVGAQA